MFWTMTDLFLSFGNLAFESDNSAYPRCWLMLCLGFDIEVFDVERFRPFPFYSCMSSYLTFGVFSSKNWCLVGVFNWESVVMSIL